jgi:hypothetical protein
MATCPPMLALVVVRQTAETLSSEKTRIRERNTSRDPVVPSVTISVSFVHVHHQEGELNERNTRHPSSWPHSSVDACRFRTAAGIMNRWIVSSAALFISVAAGVDSFRASPATRAPRPTQATTASRASNRNSAPSRSSYSLCPIAKSSIWKLQFAAEDDATSSSIAQSPPPSGRDELLRQLVDRARALGPVGVYQPEKDQDELLELAMQLSPYSDPAPARIPLFGTFDLVYSASPYLSSGRLFGPVRGRVTQEFLSPTEFCNRVDFGPLRLSLAVSCEAKSDTVVQVNFVETRVSAFGATLVTSPAKGGGEWKYIFAGTLSDSDDNDRGGAEDATRGRRFIRVLEAPNLFVIEQLLPPET